MRRRRTPGRRSEHVLRRLREPRARPPVVARTVGRRVASPVSRAVAVILAAAALVGDVTTLLALGYVGRVLALGVAGATVSFATGTALRRDATSGT